MASGKDDYKLYYWPLAGRGEFIRLIFEEANVKFEDISDWNKTKAAILEGGVNLFPTYAPPSLVEGDFQLSQTPVICKYLGKKFGMWPEKEEDVWHADQINTTVHDYIAEGRLVFHGTGFVKSYYDQKEETKPYIEWFVKERIDKWMNHFEKCLKNNNDGKGFVLGDKLTYVDLGLVHVLRATESQFPDKWNSMNNIPLLKAFKERMEARPRLAEYIKSSRCRPFEGNSMM